MLTCITVTLIITLFSLSYGYANQMQHEDYSKYFDLSIEDLMQVKVTVQKREESIGTVPISVSHYSHEDIHMADLQDVSRLELFTPGLRYGESGSDARLSMRGSRTNDIRTGSAQVVGVFVDGVYLPSTTQALSQWLDVERVEVLRGPQGILYGRNTFGGAINVISNAPSFEYEAKAKLSAGDYNHRRSEGMVNVPLSDIVSVRIAGLWEQHDGYVENLQTSSTTDDLKDENQWFIKSALLLSPSKGFNATLRINKWKQDINGNGDFGYIILGSVVDPTTDSTDLTGQFVPGNPRDGTFESTPDKGPYKIYRDYPYSQKIEVTQINLTTNFDLSVATLKTITAINTFKIEQWADGDLSNRPFAAVSTPSHSDDFFHEYQLASKNSSSLEWLTGFYYQHSDMGDIDDEYGAYIWDELQTTTDHDSSATTPTRTTGEAAEGYDWATLDETKLNVLSLFGQTSYTFGNSLRLSAGLRFNRESKRVDSWWLPMSWSPELSKVDSSANTWDHFTWRGGVDYFISKNSMVYGSVSTGFRTGGFNGSTSPKPNYDEETVTAYEIGYKAPFSDQALQLNIAAYYNNYDNMQSQELINTGNTVIPVISNAGDIDAKGIELELNWFPITNLKIRVTGEYAQATFGDYITSNPFEKGDDPTIPKEGFINLKGSDVPLTPEISGSIQLSYRYTLKSGSSIIPYFQTYLSGSYWTNDVNAPGTKQDAYTKSDFRIVWDALFKYWSAEVYVKNIENEAVLNRTVISTAGKSNIWANYGNPRTMGFAVTMSY